MGRPKPHALDRTQCWCRRLLIWNRRNLSVHPDLHHRRIYTPCGIRVSSLRVSALVVRLWISSFRAIPAGCSGLWLDSDAAWTNRYGSWHTCSNFAVEIWFCVASEESIFVWRLNDMAVPRWSIRRDKCLREASFLKTAGGKLGADSQETAHRKLLRAVARESPIIEPMKVSSSIGLLFAADSGNSLATATLRCPNDSTRQSPGSDWFQASGAG